LGLKHTPNFAPLSAAAGARGQRPPGLAPPPSPILGVGGGGCGTPARISNSPLRERNPADFTRRPRYAPSGATRATGIARVCTSPLREKRLANFALDTPLTGLRGQRQSREADSPLPILGRGGGGEGARTRILKSPLREKRLANFALDAVPSLPRHTPLRGYSGNGDCASLYISFAGKKTPKPSALPQLQDYPTI
jgi:hypothetical protein